MDEPARILAVDDSITIRKALEMILVPEGFQVELGASGAEAIEKARDFKPDLILLDFILPDMRGSEVCRALASDPATCDVPIVLISARGAEIRQAYLDAENVLEYLVKPFTPEDVYAVVNTVLASGGEALEEEVIEETADELPSEMAIEATDGGVHEEIVEAPAAFEESGWAAESGSAPTTEMPVVEAPAADLPAQLSASEMAGVDLPASEPTSVEVLTADVPADEIRLSELDEVEEPIAAAATMADEAPSLLEEPQPLAASGWDETATDADVDLDLDEPVLPAAQESDRRESIEAMFETLRAGLEGVYVEESDTPAGAIADARSYSELAALLAQQLDETLRHATSGNRFALGGDGSIRSLDDALLDTHRRVCRLLFRAVSAGVIDGQPASSAQARVLVVSGSRGVPSPQLADLSEYSDWNVFHISQDFRQLPMMVRCYGPTHVIVDLASEAARDQLPALQRLGERRMRVIGVSDGSEIEPELLAQYGLTTTFSDSPSLIDALREYIFHGVQRPTASLEVERSHPAERFTPPPAMMSEGATL